MKSSTTVVMLFVIAMLAMVASSSFCQELTTPIGMSYVDTKGNSVSVTAQAYTMPVTGTKYVKVPGLALFQESLAPWTVGISGRCIGTGKNFVDICCSTDGKVVRAAWPWLTKPGRNVDILLVGHRYKLGRLDVTECLMSLYGKDSPNNLPDPSNIIFVDGRVVAQDFPGLSLPGMLGVRGVCIGSGKDFIDVRTTEDATTIRCSWSWSTIPKRDASLLLMGRREVQGRINTSGGCRLMLTLQ